MAQREPVARVKASLPVNGQDLSHKQSSVLIMNAKPTFRDLPGPRHQEAAFGHAKRLSTEAQAISLASYVPFNHAHGGLRWTMRQGVTDAAARGQHWRPPGHDR